MGVKRIECVSGCMFVADKKAQKVSSFSFAGDYVIVFDEAVKAVDGAKININEQLYTVLYYDRLKFISLVVKRPSPYAVSFIFRDNSDYETVLKGLKSAAHDVRFSCQNFKISSYANRIAEKLADGIELAVVDVVDKSKVALCPECGMEVQEGALYCMDCGAEL